MSVVSVIALAFAAAAPAQAAPTGPLPPSLKVIGIERCAPRTVEDATNCLTGNLDNDDRIDLAQAGGDKYRPAVAQLLTSAWHLTDPASPLSADMAKRGIYYPDNAAAVLISIMDTRIQGKRVDYKFLSNSLKKNARPATIVNTPPPPPGPPTITPIAPGAGPSLAGAVDVPVEQCRRPNAVPGEIVVSCKKLSEGRLVATRQIPNPSKAAN